MEQGLAMRRLLACAERIVALGIGGTLSAATLAERMAEILYSREQVWRATHDGLLRKREAAEVVAAHLESLVIDSGGRPWSEAEPPAAERIVDDLEAAIFGG